MEDRHQLGWEPQTICQSWARCPYPFNNKEVTLSSPVIQNWAVGGSQSLGEQVLSLTQKLRVWR